MNIVRKIHDLFRVKTLAGSTLQSPTSTSDSTGSGNTYITITGGSLGGGGLSEADRSKLNSIEQGAQVNLDAFSKVLLETTNRELEQLTTTSSSIIANIPSDTANIRLVGNYPIKVSLESVSLFNYNTVTTTGDIAASYNVSYNEDGNIVIDYVSGTLFSTTDIEIIRILHREETLATYNDTQFEYTESEGTITQFIIPYQGTDFSSILFCRYETSSSESTEGTETVRELSVITELPVSPTKQQIITLSDTNANYWKYEEDENGNRYLWTDCNVYSTKEVSAYGKAEEQEMPTILNLSLLQDVALTNLSNNQVLVYNASSQKWVNIDASNLGISADNLKTLTITVNGTSYTYNPASSNQSISITTITLDDILPYISNKLDREEFFKWFTINYDSNNNVTSILANYDFYSIKGVSAYGLGDISGITRTTLSSLDDVSLSNLVADNMLAYNGNKWVNIPMSQVRGVTSWADLENKPTTISGFGITDVYTKTEVNTKISEVSSKVTELSSSKADATIQVIAGDGLTGGGNLLQDVTISLLNLNSAGTYYKVTVDTYGRITSGISLLTIADILNLQTQLDSKLNIADFNTWFTIIYNTDGTIKNIRANYDFYSVGEVSAYGVGDEEKKNYTTLAELNDVQLTNVKETDVLVYNGTKWINVDQSTIKGALSWVDIQNKPTTISGFGIVDAYTKTEIDNKLSPINSSITTINSSINTINTNISGLSGSLSSVSTKLNNFLEGSDTDTIINKWKELEAFLAGYTQTLTLADLLSVKANSSILIIAGTGLVGGGDLTANRTISLSTSGVSAGTYTKVTVDTYGRVTSGNTLSATDIPNLDWSKITSGKPTTLEGYGITDGVNSITITGSGNAITAVTISNHLLTFTKGETFLSKSTFDDLFEKVNVGTINSPVYAIKAKYHLYSVGEVSAYEFGETGGTGVSSLEELIDVQLTNLVADSILKYNGSKWVNVPITEVKGATSWDEIENKPTKLSAFENDSGYLTAITKAQVEGVLTGNITSHTHSYLPLSGGTLTGSLEINSTGDLFNEGIRMHIASNNWCGVVMCGADNTGSSGTSANTWGIHNNNGTFYINRNGSNGTTPYILCNVNGNWGIGTNSPSYKLHVVGDIYTTTGFKKSGSSDSYVLLGGGDHKLESSLSVSYAATATNADMLDGYHWTSFPTAGVYDSASFSNFYDRSFIGSIYASAASSPTGVQNWFSAIQIAHRNGESGGPGYISQIAIGMTNYKNYMWFRGSRAESWTSVITSANIGSQSVNYATSAGNADTLDGLHYTSFLRNFNTATDLNELTESGVYRLGAANANNPYAYSQLLVLHGGGDTIGQLVMNYSSSGRMQVRSGNPSQVGGTSSWGAWNTVAFVTDNVASATKLQTTRYIFNKPFDGSADVQGQAYVYGAYVSNPSDRIYNSGLQIRENNLIYTNSTDMGYAPSIGFHWGGIAGGTFLLHADGNFYLRKLDFNTVATLNANLEGNASYANIADKLRTDVQQVLSLSSLDPNTWYPCVIKKSAVNNSAIKVSFVNALSSNVPSWATHLYGFTFQYEFEWLPNSWGATTSTYFNVKRFNVAHGGNRCLYGVDFRDTASALVLYLRGGGDYCYRTTDGSSFVLYTTSTNIGGNNEYVSPRTTALNDGQFVESDARYGSCFHSTVADMLFNNYLGLRDYKLQVVDYGFGLYGSYPTLRLINANLNNSQIEFTGPDEVLKWSLSYRGLNQANDDFYIFKNYNNVTSPVMAFIMSTSNVGIGTTSPQYKLDVNGYARFGSLTPADGIGIIPFVVANSGYSTTGWCASFGTSNGGILLGFRELGSNIAVLGTSSSKSMSICPDGGNVGIGTTSPNFKLHVYSAVGDVLRVQSSQGYACIGYQHSGSYIWSVGAQSDYFFFWNTYKSAHVAKVDIYGNFSSIGEVTAKASSSDIRLKTDITDYKALSIIRSHKSIKYHWNEVAKANADVFNDDYWHYGLIAQDVQRDMPQMVSDVFKDYLVINYERLIPICWKGLQEVDDEVTKLKKRVKQLEKRLLKYESTEVFYTKGND